MKQFLSLSLFLLPCLTFAQYPSNGNQKITLGEQTTADGLIYRGLAADTTRKPSIDTMAYIILDTATNIQWQYKKATSNAWLRIGGSISSGLTGTLPVANGGTGGTTYGDSTILQGRGTSAMVSSTDLLFNYTSKMLKVGDNYFGIGKGLVATNIHIGNIATLAANTTGSNNVALGQQALGFNTTGGQNTAIGAISGRGNISGNNNTSIGRSSLQASTGSNNIGIGNDAGASFTSGSQNTIIGTSALDGITGRNLITANNVTVIGFQAAASASGSGSSVSNEVTIGNSSTATYRIFGTWSNVSDSRDKTNILPLNYGMNYIEKLKPVSFVWDMRDGGKIGINDIGFIAQDLKQSQIDIGINIPNLISGNDEKYEAAYGVLLPIIVKALQEANDKIKLLEKKIFNLENK
jgi:hypothetical protein